MNGDGLNRTGPGWNLTVFALALEILLSYCKFLMQMERPHEGIQWNAGEYPKSRSEKRE